jgi:hypothetical protein
VAAGGGADPPLRDPVVRGMRRGGAALPLRRAVGAGSTSAVGAASPSSGPLRADDSSSGPAVKSPRPGRRHRPAGVLPGVRAGRPFALDRLAHESYRLSKPAFRLSEGILVSTVARVLIQGENVFNRRACAATGGSSFRWERSCSSPRPCWW